MLLDIVFVRHWQFISYLERLVIPAILMHDRLGLSFRPARPIHAIDRQTLATNIGGAVTLV